ncbi:MAG: DUF4364 family protein [Defluviitaleaceae bacterium]|nr:DUF4364 family protein [Defluviitaleaceae bacterium]
MSDAKEYKNAENKLLLLYLINRMEFPMSRAQVTDFVQDVDFMDYYTLQQTLAVLVEDGHLDATEENALDNSTTRYVVTGEGQTALEYFEKHIPWSRRQAIDSYIKENRGKIRKDYENTATYFPNMENDEFLVKCGVYEDKRALLELVVSVDTREQAKLIQSNWRANASGLYQQIIEALTIITN